VECVRSLERAFEEDHTVENATIELKTLRMASNVPQSQVRKIVLARVLKLAQNDLSKLTKWNKLIKSMMNTASHSNNRRSEEEEEEIDEMVEVLLDLQSFCCLEKNFTRLQAQESVKYFSKCLQAFYNYEIISEESLLKWFKSPKSKSPADPTLLSDDEDEDDHPKNHCLKLREVGGKLLQMLMEADSESSSDDN
jgi:translation initiation factor eIF-2B subunit epsilon